MMLLLMGKLSREIILAGRCISVNKLSLMELKFFKTRCELADSNTAQWNTTSLLFIEKKILQIIYLVIQFILVVTNLSSRQP